MEYLAIGIIIVGILNAVFTVLMLRRASVTVESTLQGLKQELIEGVDALNAKLEPITTASSRAMGAISHLADDTKMDQALERRIGQDMMDQVTGEYGDVLELVKAGFPRVGEYIDEHPEAIMKILPRLDTLINDPDARKRLNLDLKSQSSDVSRIWSEE